MKEARSRPARTRCVHAGDDASAKASSNPLVISGTTRQSHALQRRSKPGQKLLTPLTKNIEAPPRTLLLGRCDAEGRLRYVGRMAARAAALAHAQPAGRAPMLGRGRAAHPARPFLLHFSQGTWT